MKCEVSSEAGKQVGDSAAQKEKSKLTNLSGIME
jgi:hypothetical protein